MNSCRITHTESGAVATAQCRSRENSLNEAKAAILARLNNIVSAEQHQQQSKEKKDQVGSGMRGDKMRTYMAQHGTVKDHRTEKSASFDKIMSGNFDLLW
jgi:peptide chain release factor 1